MPLSEEGFVGVCTLETRVRGLESGLWDLRFLGREGGDSVCRWIVPTGARWCQGPVSKLWGGYEGILILCLIRPFGCTVGRAGNQGTLAIWGRKCLVMSGALFGGCRAKGGHELDG